MLVKTVVSAAGADFTIEFGQEFEFADLKALVGNGAENFCVPVDPGMVWPPVEQAVAPDAEAPEIQPIVETAVKRRAPEIASKGRRK